MLRSFMLIGAAVAAFAVTVPSILDHYPGLVGNGTDRQLPAVSLAETKPVDTPSGRRVRMEPDARGHFIGDFRINGRAVEAMIDTGASVVAINMATARRIGISILPSDFTHRVNTANGTIKAAPATLSRLEIGGIAVRDVQAMVLDDAALSTTLIGMSFLSGIKRYQVENGRLLLEQ